MLNNSVYYGLNNPAFTNDVAGAMLEMMYPYSLDKVSGTVDMMPIEAAQLMNIGQPAQDKYQTNPDNKELKRDKQEKVLKNILIGAAVLGISALGYFKFKAPVLKVINKVTTGTKNLYTNVATGSKNLWNKFTNIFKTASP